MSEHLMAFAPERAVYRGQSFAVDIIGIDALGLRAGSPGPTDAKAYRIHGTEVLALCVGAVLAVHVGMPDMPVRQADRSLLPGIYVLLGCGGMTVLFAHMMPGSFVVGQGVDAGVGQMLGRVGNSGNGNEPHLHLHVQRGGTPEAPLSGKPVFFTVEGRFLVRNDRFRVE